MASRMSYFTETPDFLDDNINKYELTDIIYTFFNNNRKKEIPLSSIIKAAFFSFNFKNQLLLIKFPV